ncbi:MAG TPA: helix-turn-helix domain-containing protein [Aggregatilineales bacterium]|nr:helix-turn-helix domain-containing protein [Aggregatilineales bacterium]
METIIKIRNVYDKNCPTRQTLDRIADKYTVLVIVFLQGTPRRFSELQRMITGISQKVLTQTLRSLERDGLLTRTIYPEVPPRVEYALTPLGETLIEPLAALRNWAESHIETVIAAQARYDQQHEAPISVMHTESFVEPA